MKHGVVAHRYARALLACAEEQAALKPVGEDLRQLAAWFAQVADLRRAVENPRVTSAEKRVVLARLAERMSCQPLTRTFVDLLVDKGRLGYLPAIAATYRDLADQRLGQLRLELRSSSALEPTAIEQIRAALARRTGKFVVIDSGIEPELLGGVVARVGDTVYDSSLRSHLRRLGRSALTH
ncbi:MAG: ATP synthase F1 subunit delta [Deltaproteobacteria bacterium]|nr:ATP synthase F1 subunit delta [Deltaproteobacteria bacterium]